MKNHTLLKKLFHLTLVFTLIFSPFSFIRSVNAEGINGLPPPIAAPTPSPLLNNIIEPTIVEDSTDESTNSNQYTCETAEYPQCNGTCPDSKICTYNAGCHCVDPCGPIMTGTYSQACRGACPPTRNGIAQKCTGGTLAGSQCYCMEVACSDSEYGLCNGYCGPEQRCVLKQDGTGACACEYQNTPCDMQAAPSCNGVCDDEPKAVCWPTDINTRTDCTCKYSCSDAPIDQCSQAIPCAEGHTCSLGNGACECMCGANPVCGRCQTCNNGQCEFKPGKDCTNDSHCMNNPNGHKCYVDYCKCGCEYDTDCPTGKACNEEGYCIEIPHNGCVNNTQCQQTCERCDTEQGICVLNSFATCSITRQCKTTECRNCNCGCEDSLPPLCLGWAPEGKHCVPNGNNTGCILIDARPSCSTLNVPACIGGYCDLREYSCANTMLASGMCDCERDLVLCENARHPYCKEGSCVDGALCASNFDPSTGMISCSCLQKCDSASECNDGELCSGGLCVMLLPCASSPTQSMGTSGMIDFIPACSGHCEPGNECGLNNSGSNCECKPLSCDMTMAPACGGTCENNQVCRDIIEDSANMTHSCKCLSSCITDADCPENNWCSNGICIARQPCNMINNNSCQSGSCLIPTDYCGLNETTSNCECLPKPACNNAPLLRCEVGTCPEGTECGSELDGNGFPSGCTCKLKNHIQLERL